MNEPPHCQGPGDGRNFYCSNWGCETGFLEACQQIYIWFPPKHCMIRNGNPITIRLRHWNQHGNDYVLRDTRRTWKILYYAIKRDQGNMFITQRGPPPWALRPMSSNRELLPTLRENTQPWSMLSPIGDNEIGPKSAQITTTPGPINNGARNPISSTIDKVQHVYSHSHPGIGEDGYLCLNPWPSYYIGERTKQTIGLPANKNNCFFLVFFKVY